MAIKRVIIDNYQGPTAGVLPESSPQIYTFTIVGGLTYIDTTVGGTITITGRNFGTGARVYVGDTAAVSTTVNSQYSITAVLPGIANGGNYLLFVRNTDGSAGVLGTGIYYSTRPIWSTATGNLGSLAEFTSGTFAVAANSDSSLTYAVTTGSLPPDSTLDPVTGVITVPARLSTSPGTVTYNFTVTATDKERQSTSRSFSIGVDPETVSWVSPVNGATLTSYAFSGSVSQTLLAVGSLGNTITYSSGNLPPGITISGDTLSGVANAPAGVYLSTVAAITANTNRISTQTISFSVQPDVITWSTPANNTTFTPVGNSAITPVTLSSSSFLGSAITYSSTTLPAGLSVVGNTITGTPVAYGTFASSIIATAINSGTTNSITINWVINFWAVDSLVIGGGGGGGSDMGGGGGAGGYLAGLITVTNGTYSITVGAGGAGAPAGTSGPSGTNGNPTIALGSTALGGGGGASKHNGNSFNAGSGGSGGGGSGARRSRGDWGGLPGTGTPGQGFDGAASGVTWYPGGGGGAGAAATQTGSQISNGGIGRENSILGVSYYWAGGGGGAGYSNWGGDGGLGGGGGGAPRGGSTGLGGGSALNSGAAAAIGDLNAQTNVPGGNAGLNTGGGGGGGAHYDSNNKGGDGGSGIVIIAYPETYPALSSISVGLTYDRPAIPGFRVYRFTGGTGPVTW
jgi:hypothetical protein